ncbi:MAG: hypothetical protein U0Y10_11045 [Spirosomataceae bacterium]
MEKFFKFAVCLMVVSSTAFASGSTSYSNTTFKKVSSVKLLAKGTEKDFEAYMLNNAKRFTKKTEWSDFLAVVTLYNQKPTAILKLDANQRNQFKLAVLKLNEKLSKIGGEEAEAWKQNLNFTARTINFLWAIDVNNFATPSVELESIEVTTLVPSL